MLPDHQHNSRQMDRGMHDTNIEFDDERDFQRRKRSGGILQKLFGKNFTYDRRFWKRRETDRR